MTDIRAGFARALDFYRQGDVDRALQVCAEASDISLRRLAGQILQEQGRDEEAAAAYEAVVAAQPRDWEIWNNLGNARRAIGDLDGAIAALRRAASLRPDVVAIQVNLGSILVEAGKKEAALAAYVAATRLDPRQPELHVERGRVLSSLQRLEEARQAYEAALAVDPAVAQAYLELGITLERAGRGEALPGLLRRARAAGVAEETLAYLEALRLEREGRADEALEWAQRASPSLEPQRTQRLIARLADRLDRPALAFAAAGRANAIAAADYPDAAEIAAAFRAHVAGFAQVVTPEWHARWKKIRSGGAERPAPAFLIGFPRSGTTLLDTMLMGHPRTHVLEEIQLLGRMVGDVGDLAGLADLGEAEVERLRSLYFSLLDKAAPPPPAALVIDKLPLNIVLTPLIHRLFPDARIILALRHPCDVVLSGYMQGFEFNDAMANFLDINDAAELYDRVLSFWQRCRDIFPLDVAEVRYEELVDNPRPVMQQLLAFLGLDWDEGVLDHRQTARARGVISTPSYRQVTQPLYRRASGRWLRYRDQLAPVLPILLAWADRLSYPSSASTSG